MDAWTDERLDDLAATLRPLPAELARVGERMDVTNERLDAVLLEMREMRAQLRADMSAMQRQLTQIGWGLALTVIAVLLAFLLVA